MQGLIFNLQMNNYFRIKFWIAATILSLLRVVMVFAIVMHPGGEPDLAVWTDRPDANVVGRWGSNASFVVIAPNWIATTRHQGGSPSSVIINGISYNCQSKNEWTGGPAQTPPGIADIRLLRLTKTDGNDANLTHYARPYEYEDEPGSDVVIGGYGVGRGDPNTVFYHGKEYIVGYDWASSSNTTRRWCQNIVDSTDTGTLSGYTSELIKADFDGLGDDNYRPYEGIIALYDSGGGWFIYDSGEWKIAGLSRGITAVDPYTSTFRNRTNPNVPQPDGMDAVRISAYAQWIKQIIQPADLMEDEWVDFADFALFADQWQRTDCNSANNWCDGADFIPHNGAVDWNDLVIFADRWLTSW